MTAKKHEEAKLAQLKKFLVDAERLGAEIRLAQQQSKLAQLMRDEHGEQFTQVDQVREALRQPLVAEDAELTAMLNQMMNCEEASQAAPTGGGAAGGAGAAAAGSVSGNTANYGDI